MCLGDVGSRCPRNVVAVHEERHPEKEPSSTGFPPSFGGAAEALGADARGAGDVPGPRACAQAPV